MIILLLEFVAAIIAFTLRNKAEDQLLNRLIRSLSDYNDQNVHIKNEWDHLQQTWSCCGVNRADDWIVYGKLPAPPNSCCPNNDCTVPSTNSTMIFDRGCYGAARDLFFRYSKALGGVSIFFFFVEIVGLVLAVFLVRDLKNNYGSV